MCWNSKIGSIPKQVAEYLDLANPNQYTGHCFRRSSATILVDAGGDMLALKRHGGWRSTAVAESYVDNSVKNMTVNSSKSTCAINNTTTVTGNNGTVFENAINQTTNPSPLVFNNCTVTINNYYSQK